MENKYQQPSFKFQTNIANYEVNYSDSHAGSKIWDIDVIYKSSEVVKGHFELPIVWSREMVFGWLSRMELSEV